MRHRARADFFPRSLRFEQLEDRQLLTIYTVNSLLDNTIAGDGLTTLREAIAASNGTSAVDEIQFALDGAGPHTIVLTMGQLAINGDLTITGPGRDLLTIDAVGSDSNAELNNGTGTRVFDIQLRPTIGWNVTLRGMTLTGGDTSGRGGAIQAAGNLTIDNVRIVDNHAANNGGAIYTTWRLTVSNGSVVENNSTLAFGGGVYVDGASSVSLNESIISGNSAASGGAGLFVDAPSLNIDGSRIENNKTPASLFIRGGALYVRDTNVVATNLVIAGNEAGAGGGVFSLRSRLTFNTSLIETNKALSEDGGGVYIDAITAGVTLNDSRMSGNTAFGDGGAIYARTSLAAINDSTIAGNEAGQRGGGIMVRNQNLFVERSRISGNTAGSSGGGLVSYASTLGGAVLSVADSTIDDNTAGIDGGGIYAYRIFSPSISRNTFFDNEAGVGGGAIAVKDLQTNTLGVHQSTISGNLAVSGGGAIKAFASRVSLQNSTVTGNEVTNPQSQWGGGGVIGYFGSPIGVHHTILAGNHDATSLGPDLRLVPGSGSTLSATFSLFGDNRGTGRAETGIGTTDAAGNRFGGLSGGPIDPRLGPLATNGGPTLTHALLPNSPALDAGDSAAVAGESFVPEFDQRGMPFTRVADSDAVPGARIDIGAFERQTNPLAGDYNFNGVVDTADFIVWRKSLGSTTDLRADGNGDGAVDDDDYAVWNANFNNVLSPATSATIVAADQPPALPGVRAALQSEARFETIESSAPEEPPAKPGAVGLFESPHPAVHSRPLRAATSTVSARQDAALLAWLTASAFDRRRYKAIEEPASHRSVNEILLDAADRDLESIFDISEFSCEQRDLSPP